MTTPIDAFREAVPADVPALVTLVRTAYRGELGWTTETTLLDDERIDASGVADKIANPRNHVDQGTGKAEIGYLVVSYWPKEVENFRREADVLRGVLQERKNG